MYHRLRIGLSKGDRFPEGGLADGRHLNDRHVAGRRALLATHLRIVGRVR